MKITPLEIRQHTFEKIFRGYNIDEVDNFLSNISQEWDRVLNESKMLRMQLEIAEKEASKLREIEMTLFKTLKTAEDTSTMITEQANQQAEKFVQDAHAKGESITAEARAKAAEIIRDAENRAKYIKDEVLGEVKGLERDFRAMDNYKDNLLVQMKSLANATIDHVERFESKFDIEGIQAKFKEATTMIEQDIPVAVAEPTPLEEPIVSHEEVPAPALLDTKNEEIEALNEEVKEEIKHEPAAIIEDKIAEESTESLAIEPLENVAEEVQEPIIEATHHEEIAEPETSIFEEHQAEVPHNEVVSTENLHLSSEVTPTPEPEVLRDNLKMIEGVGPKIEEILNNAGINTFRDLATTQAYKIKEILADAGSRFASHDPTTWAEQARLAAENNWEGLKVLQDKLFGGRPEDIEEPKVEKNEVETHENHVTEHSKPTLQREQITEEMLEKVNKVKAAIRKSMLEKADNAIKDNTHLPTVNDVVSKNEGGSFFDNL